MDWIAGLKNKKSWVCTRTEPTKPTIFDFNRVRDEKIKHMRKNGTDKTDKIKTECDGQSTSMVNEKGYPIPSDEAEFARDERAAIIEFDGGPDAWGG